MKTIIKIISKIKSRIKNYIKRSSVSNLIKDKDGNNAVLIEGELFSNSKVHHKYGEVAKTVRSILKEYYGIPISIKDNNRIVFIDKHTVGEYIYSQDTQRLKNRNKTAKMNAIKEIKSIIENASYYGHKPIKPETIKAKKKRKIDASGGFDYYKVEFAFNNKEKDGYRFYTGILNVRLDKKNTGFVYDITKTSEILQKGNQRKNRH